MAGRFSVESVFKAVDRVTGPVTRMQARVGKFTQAMGKGLAAANRQVDKLARGLANGAKNLVKLGLGAVTVAAGAAYVAINKFASAIDPIAKRARRLELPIEELQAWHFIGEQSGVSTAEMDKALDGFAKRLGDAKNGLGPLVSALKDADPAFLKQLQNATDVGAAFDLYVDHIGKAGDATQKASLAAAAFGKAGAPLIGIANSGAEAIAALRKEAQENGLVSLKAAEDAEAYNDALNSLKQTISGALRGALLQLTPPLTSMMRQFRGWIVANRELIQTRAREYFFKLRDGVLQLVAAVRRFSREYDIPGAIERGMGALGKFMDWLNANGPLLKKVGVSVLALVVALKVLAAAMLVVNIAMAANPIGLIVLGIAALVAAVVGLIIWWDEIKAAFLGMPTWVKVAASAFALLFGPVGWLISAAIFVMDNWTPLSNFFSALLTSIEARFNAFVSRIMGYIESIKGAYRSVADFAGGAIDFVTGGDDDEAGAGGQGPQPQVVTPQDRTSRAIQETSTTNTSEVVIKDATGRASVPRGRLPAGVTLTKTGAF